jgi:hypothetical protein
MVAILVAIPLVLLFKDVDRSKTVEVPAH